MLKEMLLFRSHLEEKDRAQMDAGGLLVSDSRQITSPTQKGVATKEIGLLMIALFFFGSLGPCHSRICWLPVFPNSKYPRTDFSHFKTQLNAGRYDNKIPHI